MNRPLARTRCLIAGALLALAPGLTGCAQGIAGMVVKHVAMSAAKKVAADTYKQHKEEKHAAARQRESREPDANREAPARDDVDADHER